MSLPKWIAIQVGLLAGTITAVIFASNSGNFLHTFARDMVGVVAAIFLVILLWSLEGLFLDHD